MGSESLVARRNLRFGPETLRRDILRSYDGPMILWFEYSTSHDQEQWMMVSLPLPNSDHPLTTVTGMEYTMNVPYINIDIYVYKVYYSRP